MPESSAEPGGFFGPGHPKSRSEALGEAWGKRGTWTMPKMPLKPGDEGKIEYGKDPTEETRPFESFGARRADAPVALAEGYLAAAPQSASGADRYQVVVHDR